MDKMQAARETIKAVTVSIFTSAFILMTAGFVLGFASTNGVLGQLGMMIGRGALISFVLVLFVLPTLLIAFDKVIVKKSLSK